MILTKILEKIKSGKYNIIIFAISFIFIFHIYNHISTCQNKIENMADVSEAQIAEAVKKYYISDDFIKSITAAAAQVQKDGLTISGDLNVTGKFNYLPRGTIVIWNGSTAPSGWAICDGSNGTPNLRDRFVLGYGSRTINTTGGEENVTLNVTQIPAHSHSGSTDYQGNHQHGGSTSSDGLHSHFTNVYKGYGGDCRNCSHNFQPLGGSDGGIGTNSEGNHTHSISTDWQGNHYHNFSTTNTGGNQPHNNMPPFYVLAYIMKL
jgi:microcystin-dependent protein